MFTEPRESLIKIFSSLIQTQGLNDSKKLCLLNALVKILSSTGACENRSEVLGFSTFEIMCW